VFFFIIKLAYENIEAERADAVSIMNM